MKKSTRNTLIILILLLLILLAAIYYFRHEVKDFFVQQEQKKVIQRVKDLKFEEDEEDEFKINNEFQIKARIVPANAYIESQFICQAPLETGNNWTLHEESCEEAALLQVYLNEIGDTMTKEQANEKVLEMIKWQEENFGGHHDIYAEKVKEMASKFLKIDENKIHIVEDATLLDIQTILSKNHTIIAPVTSKYLKNPYYEHPGYHMLQIIGYTEDMIITNDNGTKRGADFSYPIEDFLKAMNDAGADIIYMTIKIKNEEEIEIEENKRTRN